MSQRGPRAVEIVVSAADRRVLEQMLEVGSRREAERAAIVLACAGGATNATVAQQLSVSRPTVSLWRSRFAESGLAGLDDEPRPGRNKPDLVLTQDERRQWTQWARRAKTAQYLAMRARIVLACADTPSNRQVAHDLNVSVTAVNRWRS